MKITKIDSAQEAMPGPPMDGYFDGEVQIQHLVTSAESDDLDIMSVHFSAICIRLK